MLTATSALASLAIWCAAVGVTAQAPTPQVAVVELLSWYDRGEYAAFVEAIEAERALADSYPAFRREAERWIDQAVGMARERRRLVAASAAVEIAHRLRDKPLRMPAAFLNWAGLLMRDHPPSTPQEAERWWYLASLAGLAELPAGWTLVAGYTDSAGLGLHQRAFGPEGQLGVALKRFPDEPRLRLIKAVSAAAIERWQLVPSVIELAMTHARDPVPADTRTRDRWEAVWLRNQSVELLEALRAVPKHEAALEALQIYEPLRAEIALHLGYLSSLTLRPARAIGHLEKVPSLTADPSLRYLSHYLIGRTLQTAGDNRGAVRAFAQALSVVPNARSAATHLAAALLLSEQAADRDRALAILQAAYSDRAPQDPWNDFLRLDARLWPLYMAQLRRALQ
jgi:tetratricopeptide (TPR) repeat protein